jgi:hypothetical protein
MKNFICLLLVLLASACTSSAVLSGSEESHLVFQSILVGNGGKGAVTNPQIIFAGISLINIEQKSFAAPKEGWHGVAPMVSETMDLPLPETAEVSWESADNQSHTVFVPIKNLVRDRNVFYGFRFVFIDDYVDVYLIEKRQFKVPTSNVSTVETKAFTSVK